MERYSDRAMSEWISVKKRLPEESGYYLVFMAYGRMDVMSYIETNKCFLGYCGYAMKNVTHWMPLPELPETAP